MKQRWVVAIIAILTVVLGMAAGSADAAPSRLKSLSEGLVGPSQVALDSQGNLYVTDYSRGALLVYSAKGQLLKALAVPGALGLAVDANNHIYVGSESGGSVSVYNNDLTLVRMLGAGQGEFKYPSSISIDGSGRIYVVDGFSDIVKVYESTGASAFSFSNVLKPMSIAVNDAAGEVYVSDRPLIADPNGGQSYGAAIEVFNKSGVLLRSFGQYATGAGNVALPVGIALDKSGLLYVSDDIMNVVQVFNPQNGSVQANDALYSTTNPMNMPQGVVVGKNNVVYVATFRGKTIEEYALDNYVLMDSSPASLNFSGVQYGSNPAAQTITISNTGSGSLNWTVASDQAWLKPAVGAGTTGGAGTTDIAVNVDITNLAANTYTGTISITADYGQVDTITVSLTVAAPPTLSLSNQWLTYSLKRGKSDATKTEGVSLLNVTSLPWSAASDSKWLSMVPSSGTASATSVVTVDASALAAGSYTGYITVAAPGALGGDGSSKIRVDLTVLSTTKIVVAANIPEASFTITGPSGNYTGNGSSWSVEDAAAGDYTITYNKVAGYQRPLPKKLTLAQDSSITFSGAYASNASLAALRNIVVARGAAATNAAEMKAYKNDGTATTLDVTPVSTMYGANVVVADIDGDGVAEIIVGAGSGSGSGMVTIFRSDMTKMLEFTPFTTPSGVNVAAADFDADGKAEVIVAPAGGSTSAGNVKIYAYDATTATMLATGVDITAHASMYGANIAAGDVEGNQMPDLITAPGFGDDNPATVSIWKVDTSKGAGKWTAADIKDITLSGKRGASVAAGDTDGDGADEIVAASGYDSTGSYITVLKADGTEVNKWKASGDTKYGANVTAGDLDGDGIAEIVAGAGLEPGKSKSKGKMTAATVNVFGADGTLKFSITPFDNIQNGINVTLGELGI